jgi:uncharacterized repeat protein (TIGR01451 family)
MTVVLGTAVTVVTVGPSWHPEPGPLEPDQAVENVAFDPASFRLAYVSRDRPTLVAAVPGRAGSPVLGAASAGEADFDADVRGTGLVWVSRRPAADGAGADAAHLDGDLFLQRQNGAVTRLTSDKSVDLHPALSPDGRRVAFTSDRGGSEDIWVLDVAGGAPRQLTDHPAADSWPTWSPDGKQLAFTSTRDDPAGDIYTMPATGGQPARVTTDPAADTEPAWSPDGLRLAFTTTRFNPSSQQFQSSAPPSSPAPSPSSSPTTTPAVIPTPVQLGDVVTMAVTGGAVTRVVPTDLDSGQPSWAADSQRLAFVSFRADKSGDVYVVDGSVVTPVAIDASRAETAPTWRGTQVIYTSTNLAESTDVWSADASGGDRRDHTALAGGNENGPTYTDDGDHLAYSAQQPGGGERIFVADADGRNARMLAPSGTESGDRDSDPTWSPDGTMLAFSRYHPLAEGESGSGSETAEGELPPRAVDGQPPSRVLVVRVADGALVGEVPMPAYLDGDDEQPAWSPDSKRIAFARMAAEHYSRVTPPRVDQPLRPGETFSQEVSVLTPAIPPKPEIVFFIDTSTSTMDDRIFRGFQDDLRKIVEKVRQSQPDARFALAEYGAQPPKVLGHEIGSNYYYRRLVDLTVGKDAAKRLSDEVPWLLHSTGDEGWYNAVYQAFGGGEKEKMHLRSGSSPIAVVIGDAQNQDSTLRPKIGSKKTVSRQDVIDLLNKEGVEGRFVGVPMKGSVEDGLNKKGDAAKIASATGGTLAKKFSVDEAAKAILTTITNTRVTAQPNVQRCDQDLKVTFEPTKNRIVSGNQAGFTEKIQLLDSAKPGSVLTCSIGFDVGSPVPADEVRQEITVRVAPKDRPFVRVDDVTVKATGLEGARVTYTATAESAIGGSLPAPVCTPRSGSMFPVGQTQVTCTSSVGGQPGRDIAAITVTDPTAKGRRIWVTDIATLKADQVTFGNQRDLSARVDQPCQPRGNNGYDPGDRAPAWSPDGEELAFTDSAGEQPGLCVVDFDGTDPRDPVRAADQAGRPLSDPAWSPDGSRIAFARAEASGGSTLLTVNSNGGASVVAVRSAGGASQPAYRMLPGRDLNVTTTVAGQPAYVGGDAIPVTFTVRNTSPRKATNVYLSPTIPASLLRPTQVDPRCDAPASVCRLGNLGVGDQITITVVLPAQTAVLGTITGRVTATVGDRAPISRKSSIPVVVHQPVVTVDPAIGPPGFVTRAMGTEFPPGAVIRLAWDPGVTAAPNTVTVGPDGTFDVQELIMRKDQLGPRILRAELVSGTRFGAVRTAKEFLVVPRQLAPPIYGGRS